MLPVWVEILRFERSYQRGTTFLGMRPINIQYHLLNSLVLIRSSSRSQSQSQIRMRWVCNVQMSRGR